MLETAGKILALIAALAGVVLGAYWWLWMGDTGNALACFVGCQFVAAFVSPIGAALRLQ